MKLARYEQLSEWPLAVASLIFLGAYAWSVIGDLQGRAAEIASWAMNAIWLLFVADYIVSLCLARPHGRWFVTHLYTLAIVALPPLRPLRLLRLVRTFATRHRGAGSAFRGQATAYAICAALLLVLLSGLSVLSVERDAPGSNIREFGDAIWWAVVTITSVGYGDYYPVTAPGRLIASGLMVSGLALLGTVTATFASWFRNRIATLREGIDEDEGARGDD